MSISIVSSLSPSNYSFFDKKKILIVALIIITSITLAIAIDPTKFGIVTSLNPWRISSGIVSSLSFSLALIQFFWPPSKTNIASEPSMPPLSIPASQPLLVPPINIEWGKTQLGVAVSKGDYKQAQSLLQKARFSDLKEGIREENHLRAAIKGNNVQMTELLLASGANPHLEGLLKAAIIQGATEIVKVLFKYKVDLDVDFPLAQTVFYRRPQIRSLLLKAGADLTAERAFHRVNFLANAWNQHCYISVTSQKGRKLSFITNRCKNSLRIMMSEYLPLFLNTHLPFDKRKKILEAFENMASEAISATIISRETNEHLMNLVFFGTTLYLCKGASIEVFANLTPEKIKILRNGEYKNFSELDLKATKSFSFKSSHPWATMKKTLFVFLIEAVGEEVGKNLYKKFTAEVRRHFLEMELNENPCSNLQFLRGINVKLKEKRGALYYTKEYQLLKERLENLTYKNHREIIIRLKLLAHFWSVKGNTYIEHNDGGFQCVDMEGWHPLFFEGYLLEYLKLYLRPLVSEKKQKKFLETFDLLFSGINLQHRIKQGIPGLILTGGWKGHAVNFVVTKDLLYVCNRGDRRKGDKPGITIYYIKVTPELLEKLSERYRSQDEFYKVFDTLGLKLKEHILQKDQRVGNCVWTSLKSALYALFIHFFGKEEGKKHYKAFSLGIRKYYLEKELAEKERDVSWLLKIIKEKININPRYVSLRNLIKL